MKKLNNRPTYTFRYHPKLSYFMLVGDELIDLNIAATDTAFRQVINASLSSSAPVEDVTTFVTDDTLAEDEYHIEMQPPSADETWIELQERWIGDKFINLEWLTYTSPDAHARAMANALRQDVVNHAITFYVYMTERYGISGKESHEYRSKYRDEAQWDNVKFYLGGSLLC